jgi:hypothetical protein
VDTASLRLIRLSGTDISPSSVMNPTTAVANSSWFEGTSVKVRQSLFP